MKYIHFKYTRKVVISNIHSHLKYTYSIEKMEYIQWKYIHLKALFNNFSL